MRVDLDLQVCTMRCTLFSFVRFSLVNSALAVEFVPVLNDLSHFTILSPLRFFIPIQPSYFCHLSYSSTLRHRSRHNLQYILVYTFDTTCLIASWVTTGLRVVFVFSFLHSYSFSLQKLQKKIGSSARYQYLSGQKASRTVHGRHGMSA